MGSLQPLFQKEFLKKGFSERDNFPVSTVKNLISYYIIIRYIRRQKKVFQKHLISVLVVKSVCKYARKIYKFF